MFIKHVSHSFSLKWNSTLMKVLQVLYEGWNFNSGNYLFTTDTK